MTLIAIPAAWIGYNLNFIRERRALIAREMALQTDHFATHGWQLSVMPTHSIPPTPPPRILGVFGAEGYSFVSLLTHSRSVTQLSDEEYARVALARRLFPEATIRTIHFFDVSPLGHGEMVAEPD